jgi:hypothetical protein
VDVAAIALSVGLSQWVSARSLRRRDRARTLDPVEPANQEKGNR